MWMNSLDGSSKDASTSSDLPSRSVRLWICVNHFNKVLFCDVVLCRHIRRYVFILILASASYGPDTITHLLLRELASSLLHLNINLSLPSVVHLALFQNEFENGDEWTWTSIHSHNITVLAFLPFGFQVISSVNLIINECHLWFIWLNCYMLPRIFHYMHFGPSFEYFHYRNHQLSPSLTHSWISYFILWLDIIEVTNAGILVWRASSAKLLSVCKQVFCLLGAEFQYFLANMASIIL